MQTRLQKFRRAALTCGAACALTLAFGQTAPTNREEPVVLDVFVVSDAADEGYQSSQSISGTRFVTDLKNTPFSVEVLPAEFLQEIKPSKFQDVLNHSVGTLALTAFTDDNTNIHSRGFVTSLVLRDGVRRTGQFNPVGTERVEILKGPTSVLFGITNPGGTVNLLAKKPLAVTRSSLQQTVGRWDTFKTEIDLGGPLSADKSVRYRLPASYTTTDRYLRNSGKQEFATAPVFSWQISPQTKVEVALDHVKSSGQPLGPTPAIIDGPDAGRSYYPLPRGFSGVTPAHFEGMSATLGTLLVQHNINRTWTLRSNTAFYRRQFDTFIPVRGATQSLSVPPFQYPRDSQWRTLTDKNFQENLDLVGVFDSRIGKLTAIAGLELRDDYNQFIFRNGLAPASWLLTDPTTWNYGDTSVATMSMVPASSTRTKFQATAWSAMGQLETLEGRLFLVGGVRRDSTETDFTRLNGTPTQHFEPAETSFQLGALYRVNPAWAIYANTSTGFQPVTSTLLDINNQPFAAVPITSKAYEVGIKHELFGGKFRHSLAAYEITQENIVITLVIGAGTPQVFSYNAQSGEQRSRGFEYSFNAALSENFAFFGGYSYTDAVVTSDNQNPQTVGRTLAGSFKDKVNIFGRYSFKRGGLDGLSIAAGAAYYGPAPYGLSNAVYPIQTMDVTLATLVLDYTKTIGAYRWNFSLNVDNALDERYYSNLNYEGEPRNIRLTVGVKF